MSERHEVYRTMPLVRSDDSEHVDVTMFLLDEAELADDGDLEGWLALLADEVAYTMPVQTTRWRGSEAGAPTSFHLDEDHTSLALRVKRLLESGSVWAENPPSRVRRFVSNIRVRRSPTGDLWARSSLMLTRSRGDRATYELVTADRLDRLVRDSHGALRLSERLITVDQARLGVSNLPFPI